MRQTPPTVISSIISPPSGTLNPKAGTLTVRAERAVAGQYVYALGLSGTGTPTISGSTDAAGCAVFPEQPEGNYTMTISSGTTGLVDKDGVGLPANKDDHRQPGNDHDRRPLLRPRRENHPDHLQNRRTTAAHADRPEKRARRRLQPGNESGESDRHRRARGWKASTRPSLFPFAVHLRRLRRRLHRQQPGRGDPQIRQPASPTSRCPPAAPSPPPSTLPALLLSVRNDNVATNWTSTNGSR